MDEPLVELTPHTFNDVAKPVVEEVVNLNKDITYIPEPVLEESIELDPSVIENVVQNTVS